MLPSPKMIIKIPKGACLWAHWGSKFVILARRLMWVIRYSKPDIYIKTSVSATAFHCLCVYQAQNHHTIHIGQQLCHNRHVPTPWHSAPLMSKCSVSEHVIQNLVHRVQSIGLDLYTHIFTNFVFPTASLYEPTQKTLQRLTLAEDSPWRESGMSRKWWVGFLSTQKFLTRVFKGEVLTMSYS